MIEPHPQVLLKCLGPGDLDKARLLQQSLQSVEASTWSSLRENDILFIDSTHVSKVDSDVNRLFFEILPRLPSGVIVHFHDIFYPFEYPRGWVLGGISWNEAYLLRAFLSQSDNYEILFFNDYLKRCHAARLQAALPRARQDPPPDLRLENAPAGSIWLRKRSAPVARRLDPTVKREVREEVPA